MHFRKKLRTILGENQHEITILDLHNKNEHA